MRSCTKADCDTAHGQPPLLADVGVKEQTARNFLDGLNGTLRKSIVGMLLGGRCGHFDANGRAKIAERCRPEFTLINSYSRLPGCLCSA